MIEAAENYFNRKYLKNFASGFDNVAFLIMSANNIIVLTLTIGVDYNPLAPDNKDDFHNYIKEKIRCEMPLCQLYYLLNRFSKVEGIKTQILIYPNVKDYIENNWIGSEKTYPFEDVQFYLYDTNTFMNGIEFREYNCNLFNVPINSNFKYSGTTKIYQSYLNYWQKQYMNIEYFMNMDIDGIFARRDKDDNLNLIFLEFKSSDKTDNVSIRGTGPWYPYINDAFKYKKLIKLSKMLNAKCIMIHHRGNSILTDESKVLLIDDIQGVNDQMIKEIITHILLKN